ncbi:hypothetical protein F4779DRAFT_605169 [Xylariaceae sp. FL0662B]|nr:hypothetical protein F4779DRAFT_605169 [Xylariaceae sp. FL0662B]
MDTFMNVTGVTAEHVARGYLDISGGDASQAIQLYFENPELQASFNAPAASSSSSTRQPATSSASSRSARHTGREDDRGVIHIDDDDEGDFPMGDDTNDDFVMHEDDDDDITAIARTAQEEEDAAMARRLQEEMYSENPTSADGVRAPIARTTETLAAPDPSWDFEDAIPRRAPHGRPIQNPFNQRPTLWDNPDDTSQRNPNDTTQRLRDFFRPPVDLITPVPLDVARDMGKEQKKWILVNLQNLEIFLCHALNRDHWKNEGIVSLIREHFIFLQYDVKEPMAQSYITFYFANNSHENEDNYPHLAIIDPRTGEQVKIWPAGDAFPTPAELHSNLIEFLDRYSLAANSKNPVAKAKPKAKQVDIGRMTEEEMLEMALQNSLDNDGGSAGPSLHDPDALTKSNPDIGKGKGKATDDAVDLTGGSAQEAQPAEVTHESAFSQIPSSNPHVEPPHDPATTTRIQFRHSGGRIIRRFSVTDPVRRIYEWLKAEPLEGKAGVPFELKTMPAGSDLIEELDKTIEAAGLKQGTVMIEFIEDA